MSSPPVITHRRSIFSSWFGLTVTVLLAALIRPTPGHAWEFIDNAELFTTSDHFQEVASSSDGRGGALSATIQQNPTPDRILVTRVSHTGEELWGDNGAQLVLEIADTWNSWPIDVTHDGSGGGYFAYRAGRPTYHELRVARLDAAGSFQWLEPIDNLGVLVAGDEPRVQLTPTGNGEVIVTWIRFQPSLQLYAARLDADGGVVWSGPAVTSSWPAGNEWIARPDEQGGVLIGYTTPTGDARVQRLAAGNGARLWGNDGALVWSLLGGTEDLIADGSGGAFVVRSSVGITWAQHLDGNGTATWAGDLLVHDSQTPYFNVSTQPRLCSDGAGGFIMVHGHEALFSQRVDAAGNVVWSPATNFVNVNGIGPAPSIVSDGFGGALVSYQDDFTPAGSSTPCDQINVARIGAGGNVVFDELTAFCAFSNGPGGIPVFYAQPADGVVIADGSGGAIVVYDETDADTGNHERVLAHGYDAQGQVPSPRLGFLAPDAAEPDQTGPYVVLGDYIDLSMDYTLVREDGGQQLSLSPTDQPGPFSVEGTATLTGLRRDAYHLVVDQAGSPADTLYHAVGIGLAMPCATDEAILGETREVDLSGSKRTSVFSPDGRLHVVWIEFEPESGEFQLRLQTFDESWTRYDPLLVDTARLSGPTIASRDDGTLYVVVIREESATTDELIRLRVTPEGSVEDVESFQDGRTFRHPVLATTDDQRPHLVCEAGQELVHFDVGDGFDGPLPIASGFAPASPDLAAVGDELEVVFVRDSFLPGVQEIQRSRFAGGGWSTPELLTFAVVASSPSVAFDGQDRLLYAWILDNEIVNGIPPLVHTQLRTAGVLGPMRARPGLPRHHDVQIVAAGPESFLMLTNESQGGPVISVLLRETDGNVVFPRHQTNSGTDVADAHLAAHFGGQQVFAHWRDHQVAARPVFGQMCERFVATSVIETPPSVPSPRLTARPNPFNPSTSIEFSLEREIGVRVDVFDVRGRRVRRLVDERLSAGPQSVEWNGRDEDARPVASGIYFVRMRREDGVARLVKVALVE